jgi:biopolymer transport protein ExbB
MQRRVSSRGGIQVACQRIQVGMTHAGKIVTVVTENNSFQLVIDGETVAVVARATSREIDRYKAHTTHPERAVNPCPK